MADLTTPITQLPDLPPSSIAKLTDPAKRLTKGDLIKLAKSRVTENHLLGLTLRDLKSIEDCFENYGVDLGGGAVGGGSCSSSVVCCCCASAVVKPIHSP